MASKIIRMTNKESTELIVYQLGEVKNLLGNISTKFDDYKDSTDKRLKDLEIFQAAQLVQDRQTPKIDVQKIVLAAIALVSAVVTAAFGLNIFRK